MTATTWPVQGGEIIGQPYQGTHAKDFNVKGGSDNWESENAVDIAVPVGTPVYATADGSIGPQFGPTGEGGRFAGIRLHLNESNGTSFYYAHLSSTAPGIKPGASVKAGDLLGYSGSANGVAHLHFASTTNVDPLDFVKGLPDAIANAAAGTNGTAAVGDAAGAAAAGCATLLAYVVAVLPLLVLAGQAFR